jgi:hypothetical protein
MHTFAKILADVLEALATLTDVIEVDKWAPNAPSANACSFFRHIFLTARSEITSARDRNAAKTQTPESNATFSGSP